jgi:hypothetical protein
VGRQKQQANGVEKRNWRLLKTEDFHPVHIVSADRVTQITVRGVCHLKGEMQQVVNNKAQYD